MTYQQYLRKTRKLSEIKSNLYELASHKLSKGDKVGAEAIYTQIDTLDAEIDALMKANEEGPASDEELTLSFNS